MTEGVIFDMDGTMFDTERLSTQGWLEAGSQLNIDISEDFIDKIKGTSTEFGRRTFLARFGAAFDFEAAHDIRNRYMERIILENGVPIKKGLTELLYYLRQKSVPVAVATSTSRKKAENYFQMSGVAHFLDAVVCGDSVVNGKPAPDIFLKAARELGAKPLNCFVLEDSPNGIEAGYRAGMKVIHIPDQILIDGEVKKKVYKICRDLTEVKEMIDL